MKKVLFQGLATIGAFFILWFVLNQVNWYSVLHLKTVTEKTEKALGELYWDFFSADKKEVTDLKITKPVDLWVARICVSNEIDPQKIKIHIIQSQEVNAFALPDHHLVIFTGLLQMADNEAEICGVIGHELSHMENNHVMKKLVREIGMTTLLSSATGNNSNVINEAVQKLVSTAYDRDMETEADFQAIEYIKKANMNPNGYAQMLYKLAKTEPKVNQIFTILNTHPNTYKRINAVTDYDHLKGNNDFHEVVSKKTWVEFKQSLSVL